MARTKQTSRRSTGGMPPRTVEFSVFLYDYATLNQEQFVIDVESDNCLWVGYHVMYYTMKEADLIDSFIENYELVSSHIAKFDMMNDKSFEKIEELFSIHNNEDKTLGSLLLSKLYDNIEPNLDEKFEKEHFQNTILQDGLFDEIVSYLDPLSMARLSLTSKDLYERIFKEEITKNGTANKPRFTIPPLAVVVIPHEASHQELNYASEEENSDQEESEEETSPKKKTKLE